MSSFKASPEIAGSLSHLDVFAGLGAWTIACHAEGIRTIGFIGKDKRCQDFLSRAWPGIPIHGDINELDGRAFHGVTILTAGVPCQPASRAGKQRGASDDRWLWSATIRLVSEARPMCCIFENPLGIGDVGLDGILDEVGTNGLCDSQGDVADDSTSRKWAGLCDREPGGQRGILGTNDSAWSNYVWLPCADGKVRRAPDDSFSLVDGLHRSVLGALGNSQVPQIAIEIIRAVKSALRE